MVIIIIALPFCGFGAIIVDLQWISNKGPNDLGAFWVAFEHLKSNYGKPNEFTWKMESFVKANTAKKQGTYSISYRYNGHSGVEQIYFDGKDLNIKQ
jgi:hypothetical protein